MKAWVAQAGRVLGNYAGVNREGGVHIGVATPLSPYRAQNSEIIEVMKNHSNVTLFV